MEEDNFNQIKYNHVLQENLCMCKKTNFFLVNDWSPKKDKIVYVYNEEVTQILK